MKGVPLTKAQRQRIIDLRVGPPPRTYQQIADITENPYNTVAHVCHDAGLQKEPTEAITIIFDPNYLFKPGPTHLRQVDLSYMLVLAALPDGFAFKIGSHHIETHHGQFHRDDGTHCPPNLSGTLRWYKTKGAP